MHLSLTQTVMASGYSLIFKDFMDGRRDLGTCFVFAPLRDARPDELDTKKRWHAHRYCQQVIRLSHMLIITGCRGRVKEFVTIPSPHRGVIAEYAVRNMLVSRE